jgi:hypothetical protein
MAYGVARASLLDTGLTLAALAVMVRPAPAPLGLLAALHLATVVQHLPAVYNHWYFGGLVSFTLLLASGAAWWRARGSGTSPGENLPVAFAPAARWSLILLYFLSGFHKLNADFFDPVVSCASVLYHGLRAGLPVLPDLPAMGPLGIGLTLILELGLPVLLLVPRTRRVGVAAGILFHVVMAAAGYPRFSATGLALLVLFLPSLHRPGPAFRAAVVAALLAASVLVPERRDALFLWATLGLCGVLLVLCLAPDHDTSRDETAVSWRPPLPAILGPVLILVAGMSPYLGLGTDRALSMYSNLRTEGGRSNHFLLPAGLQVVPYQRDLVQVLRSNAAPLARLASDSMVIPWAELRARLTEATASSAGVSLTYLRGGRRYEIGSAAADSVLGLPVSRFQLKFMRFRAIERTGPRRCSV